MDLAYQYLEFVKITLMIHKVNHLRQDKHLVYLNASKVNVGNLQIKTHYLNDFLNLFDCNQYNFNIKSHHYIIMMHPLLILYLINYSIDMSIF